MNPDFMNPMILAYLGDSVFELMVRNYLIVDKRIVKNKLLQAEAILYVSAKSHYQFMKEAIKQNWLSEKEMDAYKRGRNHKGPKNESKEHIHSTGFEAMIGMLYLEQNQERLEEIFQLFKEFVETKMKQK